MRAVMLLACVLCLTTAQADTSSQELKKAIDTWDIRALRGAANQTFETTLASAVLQAYAGKDTAAMASLEKLLASSQLDNDLRFVALEELGALHLRNQQYALAITAFESALPLAAAEKDDVEDTLRYARAHADVPPMTVTLEKVAPERVKRDSLDMPRVSARINGTLDFERMTLEILETPVSVTR